MFASVCEIIYKVADRVTECVRALIYSVRPQHSALPLILFVFIHGFALVTQLTHSFYFHAYLISQSLFVILIKNLKK